MHLCGTLLYPPSAIFCNAKSALTLAAYTGMYRSMNSVAFSRFSNAVSPKRRIMEAENTAFLSFLGTRGSPVSYSQTQHKSTTFVLNRKQRTCAIRYQQKQPLRATISQSREEYPPLDMVLRPALIHHPPRPFQLVHPKQICTNIIHNLNC